MFALTIPEIEVKEIELRHIILINFKFLAVGELGGLVLHSSSKNGRPFMLLPCSCAKGAKRDDPSWRHMRLPVSGTVNWVSG